VAKDKETACQVTDPLWLCIPYPFSIAKYGYVLLQSIDGWRRGIVWNNNFFGMHVAISHHGIFMAFSGLGYIQVYQQFDEIGIFRLYRHGLQIEREAAINIDLSVSISDTGEVAIGNAYAFGGKGRVIVYQYSYYEDSWEKKGQWLEGERGENFGDSVSLSGDGPRLVVGSGWLGEPFDSKADSPDFWLKRTVKKRTDTRFRATTCAISRDGKTICCGHYRLGKSANDTEGGEVRIYLADK